VTYHDDDAPRPRVRIIPAPVVASFRALVDNGMDRVLDHPYDIRNRKDFERHIEGPNVGSGGAMVSASLLAVALKRGTPFLERIVVWGGRSAKFAKFIPAAKTIALALPVAMDLTHTLRQGVREIQVLASYFMHLLREEGIEPERGLVTTLTLSIALDPERPPDLSLTPARAGGGLTRRWIMRVLGRDNAKAVRRRSDAYLAAIDRLDLPELAREWQKRQPYEIE
jgi:hypothetical protein